MELKSRLNAVLSSLAHSHTSPIAQLDGQTAYCVLAASVFMRWSRKISGAEMHCRVKGLLAAGIRMESDLRSWMAASFSASARGLWDACRKQADEFLEAGVSVFTWSAPFSGPLAGEGPSRSTGWPCPAVLFGKGNLNFDRPLLAVFNSRKPRLISPHASWLEALRFFFRNLDSREIALAASFGTLTYDLVCAHAGRSGLSQLLVAPLPVLSAERELSNIHEDESANRVPLLSCMLDTELCPKRQAQVCRDRVLGALVHFHLVLEVRSGGNLLAVLEQIQSQSPRPQFVLEPEVPGSSGVGNYALLEKFSGHAYGFRVPCPPDRSAANSVQSRCLSNMSRSAPHGPIIWDDYLYHYTRANAGPWPGETYRQYLLDLLDASPLSGHSALETLIRILREGLVRAGSKMVRGKTAVISWSSHPPDELCVMRKWNRGLARWNVEPYGIAVRRDVLRSLGAKPAIYGSELTYSRLAENEKYRFQLSRCAGDASWRNEREWRVRGNLALDKIKSDGVFAFVPAEGDKEKLCDHVKPVLPIVVFDASESSKGYDKG